MVRSLLRRSAVAVGRRRPAGIELRRSPAVARTPPRAATAADARARSSSPPTACARTWSRSYAAQGLMPTMADFLKKGDEGLRQRPADPGAAQHRRRLVQPRDGRLAGRPRLDQQHVPHQRRHVRQQHLRVQRRRAPGGDDRPERRARAASRSPRSSGPAASRPRPRARRSTSGRSSRAAASRRTTSARADNEAFTRSFGLQFDHPGGLRRATRRSRPRRRPPATGWTNVPASFSPAQEMRLRVLDFGTDKYGLNAYIFDSTNDGTTNYDRVLFSRVEERRPGGRHPAQGRVGRRQGQDRRTAPSAGLTAGLPRQGRGAHARPVAGPPVPHLGLARQRALGRRGPASRASPATSPSTSPRRSRRRRPATSRSSRPGSCQRGDLRRAGRVLVDRPPPDAPVRRQDLPPGPPARRLSRDRRGPAPVPRARQPDACPTARPTRPTTTSTSTASRTTASPRARRSSATPTPRRTTSSSRPRPRRARTRRRSSRPTTASRRSSWRSTPARCSWTSSCCRTPRRRTAAPAPARRSARRRPAGPAARSRST